jgi:hypothetical protein
MKIAQIYSHLNGLEWLMVHKPKLLKEIEDAITAIDAAQMKTKESKEKTMRGKMLYSPELINAAFVDQLEAYGWSEKRVTYYVTDDHKLIQETIRLPASEQKKRYEQKGKTPIFSYNQTDFVKDRVAIEVQLGKYSFIAYDLFVKHMAFFVGDLIEVGIEILPMKSMQGEMSSGPGYFEGALYDLVRQGRGVPAVPLVLIGIVP